VDIVSEIDLTALLRFHTETGSLATLAAQPRLSARQLLFDSSGRLVGRQTAQGVEWAHGPVAPVERLGFTGIHVIEPAIFSKMSEKGIFPITRTYLRLAGEGERVLAFRADGQYWQDIGSAEKLECARKRASGSLA
jgi:NDP-sugar pyrophosphorylase family protein